MPFDPSWREVLASYLMLAAIPLALWVWSEPLLGTTALASGALLVAGVRRMRWLVWCVSACEGLTVDLGDRARVTVRWA